MKQVLILVLLLTSFSVSATTFNAESPQISFASEAIRSALKARGESASFALQVDAAPSDLKPEGFRIKKAGGKITVIGKDDAGAMYGGLDLAETIRSEGVAAVKEKTQNPYLQMRGVKFNIPLDVRTPSYSDSSDAAMKNIPEMWNMAFWKEYIDTLARYRYNYISIWSLHPFPSMVKVPEYPDVALQDVKRGKGPFEEYYSLTGTEYGDEDFRKNLETVKKMTIEDKIRFWREVMAYGKSRNVDFYVITWNIFTYGVDGKHGINEDPANEKTIDYFRKSVKQLILTYPDLAGIGITTGENMHSRKGDKKMGAAEKEDWMVKTYVAGTLDALKEQPARKIRFIHRQHQTGEDMVLRKMQPLIEHPNVDFIFSFKYAKAHVYSATQQPYHDKFVRSIRGKVKTIWTLRNDDVYFFRWGSPDFVREFVKNIPYDVSQGYYYGHDGWINGREFTQRGADSPRQLEVKKHWMQWMLWGRMAYNPDYSNERIAAMLQARHPEVDGAKLLDAWQKASRVYPRVTGFHWGHLDFIWYIEGCRSHTRVSKNETGFHDVECFLRIKPHKYCGVQSIQDFAAGKKTDELTPLALADLIEKDVEDAEKTVEKTGKVRDKELRLTLDDIRIICEMGRYFADKIRGSAYVALARKSRKKDDKAKAVDALTKAAEHYKKFVALVTANHIDEVWTNRVGTLNWKNQIADAMRDIEIAREID